MSYDAFAAVTFISGPAILTNACAVLQNGATVRYNLAITQWREFQASIAAGDDDRLSQLYADPKRALSLAERRIQLQLRALGLLGAGAGMFGATTVCGLIGAFVVQTLSVPESAVNLFMMAAGVAALGVMLAAIGALALEGACGWAMAQLHNSPLRSFARRPVALLHTAEGAQPDSD